MCSSTELCISCKNRWCPRVSLSLTLCSVPPSLPCSCICTSDPGGVGTAADPDVFRGSHTATLVLLNIVGARIRTYPGTSSPPSTGSDVGRARHICFRAVSPLGQKRTAPAAKAQGRTIPRLSAHHLPIFSLAGILQLPGLWNLSMDIMAQSANSHKSVAFLHAPCSGRVTLSPQTQGQTLPVLPQPKARLCLSSLSPGLTQTYSNSFS